MSRYERAVDAKNDILALCTGESPESEAFYALLDMPAQGMVLAKMIGGAPNYYITADMAEVIGHAGESLPDYELTPQDLPSPSGFMYLEEPIHFVHTIPEDNNGPGATVESSIRAIGWCDADYFTDQEPGTDSKRVYLWWMSYRDDEGAFWRWMMSETKRMAEQDGIGDWTDEQARQWVYENTSRWVIDAMQQQKYEYLELSGKVGTRFFPGRFVLATWMLMRQRATEEDEVEAPRHARKRYERKHGHSHGKLTVVYLRGMRHYAEQRSRGEGQKLSVRFPVSGHWRNQWYPSIELHKPIWIAPYIKGPSDAPLKVSDSVRVFKEE